MIIIILKSLLSAWLFPMIIASIGAIFDAHNKEQVTSKGFKIFVSIASPITSSFIAYMLYLIWIP